MGCGPSPGLQLAVGVIGLWMVLRVPTLDRLLSQLFAGIVKRMTDVDITNYANMLRLSSDYGISELFVDAEDWLAVKTLADLDLSHEGLLVLGIVRGDRYFGAPKGNYVAQPGDTLLVYGPVARLAELDDRPSGVEGEHAHRRAVAEQRRVERAEALAQAQRGIDTPNTEGAVQPDAPDDETLLTDATDQDA